MYKGKETIVGIVVAQSITIVPHPQGQIVFIVFIITEVCVSTALRRTDFLLTKY